MQTWTNKRTNNVSYLPVCPIADSLMSVNKISKCAAIGIKRISIIPIINANLYDIIRNFTMNSSSFLSFEMETISKPIKRLNLNNSLNSLISGINPDNNNITNEVIATKKPIFLYLVGS